MFLSPVTTKLMRHRMLDLLAKYVNLNMFK